MTSQNIVQLKKFGAGDRVHVQAQQVWIALISLVMMNRTIPSKSVSISYGELAKLMGRDPRAGRTLNHALGIVGWYCAHNKIPTLNSIVVNQETGVPGDHVVTRKGKSYRDEQKAVTKFDWFSIRVPTTGAFRKVWEELM